MKGTGIREFAGACFPLLLLVLASSSDAALIHHYQFDTGAMDSVGGANGVLVNGATVTGGVLQLDGVDDFVQLSTKIVPTSGSYTVALFARQDSAQTSFVEWISQGFSTGPAFYLGHNPSGILRASDSWLNTGVSLPLVAAFHHFALVVDASVNDSFLYVNGQLAANRGFAISTTALGADTRFGRQFDPFAEFFHGALDDNSHLRRLAHRQ